MHADDQILDYLKQHPDAKDTLDGIMSWWLLGKEGGPTLIEVKMGLDKLVARGSVIAEHGPDGRVYYSLADAKTNPQDPTGIDDDENGN
ncbi:MAG TPA: hypothetical protein VNN22_06600 [Verrucomicrobiae bacterium]|nr:hypothetical protein [Verrucomicrobiae bacterium]